MKYLKEYFRYSRKVDINQELLEYLSYKFNKKMKSLSLSINWLNASGIILEYDSKRVLKIDKIGTDKHDIRLFNYLIEHGKDLPIAKIYHQGYIDIPHKFLDSREKQFKNKFEYLILEKVEVTQELVDKLKDINKSGKFLNEITGYGRYGKQTHVLTLMETISQPPENERQIQRNRKIKDALKDHPESELINELFYIFEKLNEHNIRWADVHEYQFGRNHKGQLVGFDIDGLYNDDYTNDRIKTHIREQINQQNIYMKDKNEPHMAISSKILKARVIELLGSHQDDREEMKKELYDAVKSIFEKHGVKIFDY